MLPIPTELNLLIATLLDYKSNCSLACVNSRSHVVCHMNTAWVFEKELKRRMLSLVHRLTTTLQSCRGFPLWEED
jgi:hypothetical protein